ncbi:protein O-mannosyl-transferase TMEM260-like [Watersipora subatra]|uniref:protein O-mannosyl-transferase TMEM260-like n=1 Tax=Watersipora subatra TaxID=2589382 RepID=UPI00355B7D06
MAKRNKKQDTQKLGSKNRKIEDASVLKTTFSTTIDPHYEWSWEMAIGLYLGIFGVYAYTAYPSVPGGDSGELLSAACELGVAHPPGYPLWTILSSLTLSILPFNAAFSVNLLTCATAASASVALYITCQWLTGSFTMSALATIIFSLSPLTWTWAVTAEVFALNNLFTTLLILVLHQFEVARRAEERKYAVCLGAFLSGLALTNQHTIVLYLPAIVSRVAYKVIKSKELNLALILAAMASGAAGLSPYFYLYLSSYRNTARWSWGDQTTLQGFLSHFLREEYGSFSLGAKEGVHQGFMANLIEYKRSVMYEFTHAGYALACLGIVQVFIDSEERIRRVVQTMLAALISYVTFFCWRANLDVSDSLMREVVERFWLQTNLIWAILFAMGCKFLYIWLKLMIPHMMKVALIFALATVCLARGWQHCNHHSDTTVKDFASSIISSFPNNSLVLTKGDLPSGTLRYMQFCENIRTDVTLVEQELMSYEWFIPKLAHLYPSVTFPGNRWYKQAGRTVDGLVIFTMLNFLDANIDKRPVFVCIGMQEKESSWASKYQLLPYGPCHQVVRKWSEWVEPSHPYQDNWSRSYTKLRSGSWESVANEEMWNAKVSKATYVYKAADEAANITIKYELFSQAYEAYKSILTTHVAVPKYFHKNYALACERMARAPNTPSKQIKKYISEAVEQFILYRDSGVTDEQMPAIEQAIASMRGQLG